MLALYEPSLQAPLVHHAGIHPEVNARAFLGLDLFCLGFPQQALARINAAITEARTLAHPASLASSLGLGCVLLSLVGDDTALGEWADKNFAVAAEQGFAYWVAAGPLFYGWLKIKNGDVTDGLSLLRSGTEAFRATGMEVWTPYFLALEAAGCAIGGQIDKALTLLDEALRIVEEKGGRWIEAELHRLKGQLLLRQGCHEAAEAQYRTALRVAGEQEARMWELRAAMSLARLWNERGRRIEAHDLLAAIYGWFTEGFGTPDLKEAKAVLDELGGA
jgi:predicted ATPase